MPHKSTRHNGSAIRDFRTREGLTMDELAQRISISTPHMRNIENEIRDASLEHVDAIADVLHVRPASLLRTLDDPARDKRHNGRAVRDFRLKAGLTIDDLAAQVGDLSPSHLRNIENELRDASALYLYRIADALGVRAASLVRDRSALTGEPAPVRAPQPRREIPASPRSSRRPPARTP